MQQINVDIPNSGNGSELRDAFIITNQNFSELDINKADLVGGKLAPSQFPLKLPTISINPPSGVPADGEQWIQYIQ